MKTYYVYDQDKMTPNSMWKLKMKMFPYLNDDDIRLNILDRNIIWKEFTFIKTCIDIKMMAGCIVLIY